MKLDVWNEAIDLFRFTDIALNKIPKVDIKLRSQILDVAQSISANISEGYCRRSLKEYLQFLYFALGSSGEAIARMIGIKESGQLLKEMFDKFDELHYSTENKLLALVNALQKRMKSNDWNEDLATAQKSPSV
jgi:four helix bundle protein